MSNRGIWKAGLLSAAVLCSVTAVIAATSSRRHSDKIDVVDVTAPESVADILAFDPFEGSILPAAPMPEEVEAVAGVSLNSAVALFNEGAKEVEGAMEVSFDPMEMDPAGVENNPKAMGKAAEETRPIELPATISKSSKSSKSSESDDDDAAAWLIPGSVVAVLGAGAGASVWAWDDRKHKDDDDKAPLSPSTP